MSTVNTHRYDLRIEGADETTLSAFAKAFDEKDLRLQDYIAQDPDDPSLFSTEVLDYYDGGLYRETIEEELHSLAVQFPDIKLHFIAQDLDEDGNGYELKFHGDFYQRADYVHYMPDFHVPVPFADRKEALLMEMERSNVVDSLVNNLCHNTDYDLLYAQKKALLGALRDGTPIPKEALQGLVNFLDQVGDLGEALGRFQYDDLEPTFPMQPEYVKREVTFEPEPPQKVYLLCEEHEGSNAIREFRILATSQDEAGLKKLLTAKAEQDEFGLAASNGIADQSETHFQTEFDSGFVEYYILEEPVHSKETLQEMLSSPEYDTTFIYPEGFRGVIMEAIRQIAADEGYGELVDIEKAADAIMADKEYQAELKAADCYWYSSNSLRNPQRVSDHVTSYIYDKINLDKDFFITLGAMEKVNYPDNLKEILVNSIYDVCKDHHLPVNHAEEKAEEYMRTSAFKKGFHFLNGQDHIDKETEQHQEVIWACYDFAEEQLVPQKSVSLDQRISRAEGTRNVQQPGKQFESPLRDDR